MLTILRTLRYRIFKLFKKGEYAAASFYYREWLRSPDTPEGIWFKNLFEDEFNHWRYFARATKDLNIKSNKEAKDKFIVQQEKTIEFGDPRVGSNRNYVTSLKEVQYDHDLVGFSSRFLTYQKMLGSKFTKDLDPIDKVAFIMVVDESNHLLYKFINLIDPFFDYSYLWYHPHKTSYSVPRKLLVKWVLKYVFCILLYLPIDILRILRTQILKVPGKKRAI